jgi:hypothetical protein
MKQPVPFALRAILSIVLATFSLQVWGLDCSSTDISLSSQVDVDNFQSTYGGGGVCDMVSGSLTIVDSTDITNLDGLSSLTSIDGDLKIYENDALTNLDGLSSLTSVGGDLRIGCNGYYCDNDTLTNLDGLSSLTSVGGDLKIYDNDALTNLDGLSSLTSVGGDLGIGCQDFDCGNNALTNIDGLLRLTSVGGNLDISSNHALTNLNGLSSLISIDGGLDISWNGVLTNLDGLASLTSVGGDMSIERNGLTNLDGLSSLTSLGGGLHIKSNNSLTNLDGLSNLTILGDLEIDDNDALSNIGGLSSLTSIGGYLNIYDNDALTNLDGLSNLTSVGGDLDIGCQSWVCGNGALTNIDGLSRLTSVGGSLGIWENLDLANLNGLSSLTSIGGDLNIRENTSLTNLDGLSSLTNLGGGFSIRANSALTNLDGLSNLTSVGGILYIYLNDALTNLDGLSNLTSVDGDLSIINNDALTNLVGLSSLTSIDGVFSIGGNDALINLVGLSSLTSLGGGFSIGGNDALTNLVGLSSLTSVGGDLDISRTALTSLVGLSSLTSIGGVFSIDGNYALTNLNGLSKLTSVGKGFDIRSTGLTNLDGLSSLTSIEGYLLILFNDYLTNIDGLSNLTSVGGYLEIQENVYLTNIDGLSSLTSVGGDLDLSGAFTILTNIDGLSSLTRVGGTLMIGVSSLTNIDGLSSLTSIGGGLRIGYNLSLTNLDGLSNLTSVGEGFDINSIPVAGDLNIFYNPVLSRCSALSPLLGWPVGPPYDNVGGQINLVDNKPGCNSVQEIFDFGLDPALGLTAPHVTASVVSSGQVTLTFTPAFSFDISWPITGYQAQCVAEDQSIATQTGTSPITITGLANNQVYSCSVSAITGQGLGPASNTVSANFTVSPFTIGGHVSGLSGTGLVLRNNFDDDLEISADGSFTFATALYDGSTYSITVLTQPTGSDQTCSISNSNGTVSGADVVDVTVTCFKPNNELRNIATRAEVRTGNEILIGGFVIIGDTQKCVVIQGLGQSVAVPVGVARLADPVLQLKSGLTTIAQNDNWQVQDNPADVQAIQDAGRALDDMLEAAIYKCLNPGAYTALVTGYNNSTGVGMVAIYDADDGTAYLKNIATRSWVGTDHAISIAGFVVTGDTPKQILVRGLGPSMESKFPPNSPLLLDPQLRLYQGDTLIETNDDWGDAANAAEIGALPEPLPPTDAREPAILMTLEPGLYTAHLLGVDGTTGIGNVAVYDLTGRQ